MNGIETLEGICGRDCSEKKLQDLKEDEWN